MNFPDVFKALTGHDPFPWQTKLFAQLSEGRIPSHCDIPTGLGKTSVMAIWLVAKALGAHLPRRLIYVVDRRVVVDQATTVAVEIRDFVEASPEVKQKLNLTKRLPISTLRGQHLDNREWTENPATPAIIIGTVDMIGSRLLFEGYGLSRKMRPYQAGLLGADSLLVLDEAHLVPPFEALLETISANAFGPKDASSSLIPPFRLMTLSATGRRKESLLGLTEDDLREGTLTHQRLTAKKTLTFHAHDTKDAFTDWMAGKAWEIGSQPENPQRVAVFCDSRKAAEQVFEAISKKAKTENVEIERELLVGGRRVLERQIAADWLERTGWLVGAGARPEKPTFLIATSAGEVGVDLDADHLVCDLVEWERMVQRLGRVNRRGRGDAKVLVLLEKEPEPNAKESAALAKSLSDRDDKEQKLVERFQEKSARPRRFGQPFRFLPPRGEGVEVSPLALRDLQKNEDPKVVEVLANATTPTPLRPALSRALVDAWSMTSLAEHTGRPKIAPWLRGWLENERPQTQVAWRTHLPLLASGEAFSTKDIVRYFDAAPVHVSEVLETETERVFLWLESRAKALLKTKPDERVFEPTDCIGFLLDASGEPEDNPLLLNDFKFEDGDKRAKENLKRRLEHRLFVLDARLGGLSENGILDHTIKAPVHTADDGKPWMEAEGGVPIVHFQISHAPSVGRGWLRNSKFPLNETEDAPATEWLSIFQWDNDGGGADDRSISPREQSLQVHQETAERCMSRMAKALDLPEDLARAVCLAARIHDEGKDCERWQDAFNAPRDAGRPFAKTKGPISQARLAGFRHELLSMIRARSNHAWKELSPDQQDLVLHLIAAHHGLARPIIGIESCDDFPPSMLRKEAVSIALRFANLQRIWGPWGLAWLESLLRAADQQASRSLD